MPTSSWWSVVRCTWRKRGAVAKREWFATIVKIKTTSLLQEHQSPTAVGCCSTQVVSFNCTNQGQEQGDTLLHHQRYRELEVHVHIEGKGMYIGLRLTSLHANLWWRLHQATDGYSIEQIQINIKQGSYVDRKEHQQAVFSMTVCGQYVDLCGAVWLRVTCN